MGFLAELCRRAARRVLGRIWRRPPAERGKRARRAFGGHSSISSRFSRPPPRRLSGAPGAPRRTDHAGAVRPGRAALRAHLRLQRVHGPLRLLRLQPRQSHPPRHADSPEEAGRRPAILWEPGFRTSCSSRARPRRPCRSEAWRQIVRRLHPPLPFAGVEVYPLDRRVIRALAGAGVDGVTVYQETYDPVPVRRGPPRRAQSASSPGAWKRPLARGRSRDAPRRHREPPGAGRLAVRGASRSGSTLLWLQKPTGAPRSRSRFRACASRRAGSTRPIPSSTPSFSGWRRRPAPAPPRCGLSSPPASRRRSATGSRRSRHAMSAGSRTEPGGYAHPGEAERAIPRRRRPHPRRSGRHACRPRIGTRLERLGPGLHGLDQ